MMRNSGAQMQRILFLGIILVMGLSGATYAQESIDEPQMKNPNRPSHFPKTAKLFQGLFLNLKQGVNTFRVWNGLPLCIPHIEC